MDPLSRGEKVMDWIMKNIMPWLMLVLFLFCLFMAVTGMMGWWE